MDKQIDVDSDTSSDNEILEEVVRRAIPPAALAMPTGNGYGIMA